MLDIKDERDKKKRELTLIKRGNFRPVARIFERGVLFWGRGGGGGINLILANYS